MAAIKINLYHNERKKVWRRLGTAHDPKHTTPSVKHGGAVCCHEHACLPVVLGYWRLVMMWQNPREEHFTGVTRSKSTFKRRLHKSKYRGFTTRCKQGQIRLCLSITSAIWSTSRLSTRAVTFHALHVTLGRYHQGSRCYCSSHCYVDDTQLYISSQPD